MIKPCGKKKTNKKTKKVKAAYPGIRFPKKKGK